MKEHEPSDGDEAVYAASGVAAMLAFAISIAAVGCSSEARPPPNPMYQVAAGWFTAGCTGVLPGASQSAPHSCRKNPPRRLWISAFEMDRYEISQADYAKCVAAGACAAPPAMRPFHHRDGPAYPVRVSWDAASAFCTWRGARLPSEAEWEKAARGTDERLFPWGDSPPDCQRAAFERGVELPSGPECADHERPTRIGSHPAGASPYGIEDLLGNVGEWTLDLDLPRAIENAEDEVRLVPVRRGGIDVLAYDRSSMRYIFLAMKVVDPVAGLDGAYMGSSVIEGEDSHVVKGTPGAGTLASTPQLDQLATDHSQVAGFRCVRPVPGPPAPQVPLLDARVHRLPFDEREVTP